MDRRETPANGRVAHVSLRGQVTAERYVEGEPARIAVPLTDLLAAPGGARDRQLTMGARVLVLDRQAGHAFVRCDRDGYVGHVAEAALGPDRPVTHWVAAPATHLYPAPNLKQREIAMLSHGAELRVIADAGRFLETDAGFVPAPHLRALEDRPGDPVAVAELFVGTPYLWGGNSRSGIDCSGLVQAAHLACGIPCPGDTDLQQARLGHALPDSAALQRGDVIFWKGHVALMVDAETILHANAHRMMVNTEGYEAAVARILTAGEGPVTARKRL
ncbi:MAG: C40 family peptidase [Paracoccaceae bacterium]|nr:C40 family peptidase [Paracoccaceae bacterium]